MSQRKVEDTKEVIRIRKSVQNGQYNYWKKMTKERIKIYKALHRKLKI